LPLEEISVVKDLTDARLNMAKAVLAFEATKVTHGAAEAEAAWKSSMEAFHSRPVEAICFRPVLFRALFPPPIPPLSPLRSFPPGLEAGVSILSSCAKSGLTQSSSEARRLIEQGGIYINDRQVKSIDEKLTAADFVGGNELRLRKGKKKYLIVEITN